MRHGVRTGLQVAGGALLGFLLLSSALAQELSPEPEEVETLTVGDKVTVSVYGQTDLSGDFLIDGNGAIQLPLVGRLKIAGLTPLQAEARIRDGLLEGYLREAVVNVRIAELKPVYIMGEVRSPGSYPFRHGLKVLGAVALAGGYRVGDQSLTILKSEFLLADERLRLLDASRELLAARRIRLETERDNLERLPPPAPGASKNMLQLLKGEQEIFDFQRRARKGETDLLNQQIARLEAEKTALTEQAQLVARQVDLSREQVGDYTKLVAGGNGLRPVMVEREREYARVRSEAARIKAESAKNETAVGELSLRLREADTTFMRRVVTDLQETRQKILEVERSIPIAREIYESRRRRLIANGASDVSSDWNIQILRQIGVQSVTIQAQFETALRPGDIVQIAPVGGPAETDVSSAAISTLENIPPIR